MKLLANSSYGYQIIDRSRHTMTKYLSDEDKCSYQERTFKELDHVNNASYEVEITKPQIERTEPIIVRFFILQSAKLRMLQLYYNFSTDFCDVHKFEESEEDTDSLYLNILPN